MYENDWRVGCKNEVASFFAKIYQSQTVVKKTVHILLQEPYSSKQSQARLNWNGAGALMQQQGSSRSHLLLASKCFIHYSHVALELTTTSVNCTTTSVDWRSFACYYVLLSYLFFIIRPFFLISVYIKKLL